MYPMQPGVVSYFQFNNDGTWSQAFTFGNTAPDLTASSGTYVLKSDTTFEMIAANNQVLPCKITRLTPAAFTFHRTTSTLFDGITPGTIERIFILKK
ncbi:hypothetical protein BEL04_10495 [Mucilaginibacter sp. PPCGB 2223]|nr:hypothetical protein BEL04_10495 [Mucilaginibacter sp. PPCGB 2223]